VSSLEQVLRDEMMTAMRCEGVRPEHAEIHADIMAAVALRVTRDKIIKALELVDRQIAEATGADLFSPSDDSGRRDYAETIIRELSV